jgi:hypothetical protein
MGKKKKNPPAFTPTEEIPLSFNFKRRKLNQGRFGQKSCPVDTFESQLLDMGIDVDVDI